mmetsp:Transcript_59945/g.190414  ORF Transcript_59945/g.190414 Transcript_59945/m.190414 type:complete len:249 (+) Transcript_59945:996-1742(+)
MAVLLEVGLAAALLELLGELLLDVLGRLLHVLGHLLLVLILLGEILEGEALAGGLICDLVKRLGRRLDLLLDHLLLLLVSEGLLHGELLLDLAPLFLELGLGVLEVVGELLLEVLLDLGHRLLLLLGDRLVALLKELAVHGHDRATLARLEPARRHGGVTGRVADPHRLGHPRHPQHQNGKSGDAPKHRARGSARSTGHVFKRPCVCSNWLDVSRRSNQSAVPQRSRRLPLGKRVRTRPAGRPGSLCL